MHICIYDEAQEEIGPEQIIVKAIENDAKSKDSSNSDATHSGKVHEDSTNSGNGDGAGGDDNHNISRTNSSS